MGKMQKVRWGLVILSIIMIIGQVATLNYSDLSWGTNTPNYASIITMSLLILSMALSIRYVNKNQEN